MTHPLRRILGLLTLLTGTALATPLAAAPVTLEIDQGRLLGATDETTGVSSFRAIPYALPPIGERRWRAPDPAPGWTGTRVATEFSPECVQTPYPERSVFARPFRQQSEDCLYLNVWTAAADGEARPVMVWFHGGGLSRGSGATPTYDGSVLARKGIVLVTVNYRLGTLGFMAHPALTAESPRGVSGNYGFLDQALALQWVRDNIEAFGGDPDNVTIFGESAGATSVSVLMAMPQTRGLFHRAIAQSGAAIEPQQRLKRGFMDMRPAEAWGLDLSRELDDAPLARLRALPAHVIHTAGERVEVPSRATVDGVVLPDQPALLYARGAQHDVPVLLGFNADEGTSLLAPSAVPDTPEAYRAWVQRTYGDASERFLTLYPASSPRRSYYEAFRDGRFGQEMLLWADATSERDGRAWMYYFTHYPPGPYQEVLRAYHAGEIRYAFGNVHLFGDLATDADRRLGDLMSDYWVNFATDGDPNGPGLPTWTAWDPETRNHMQLDGADGKPGMDSDLMGQRGLFYRDLSRVRWGGAR